MKKALLSILFLAASAAPVAALQERATIKTKKDPKPKVETVLEENIKGVICSVAGGSGRKPYLWREIESIDYETRPRDLTQGISSVRKGDYDDGLKLLEKFRNQKSLSPVFRQQALFYYAQAAESSINPRIDEAIATYKELLQEFKQSRFLEKANERIVACLSSVKKFDEALKILTANRQEAIAAKIDEEVLRNFDFLEANLLEIQDKLAEAANAYDKLAAASTSNPEIAELARIGSARCQMKKGGDASRARGIFEDAINKSNDNTSPIVLAAAWNGLGEVQLMEGRKEKKEDKVREALFSFLRGIVQYYPGENDRSSEYERSLFLAAQAFDGLAQLTTDENLKKLHQARADEKRRELLTRFPLSTFVRKG